VTSSSTYGEYIDMSLTYAGNENYPLSANFCFDLINNAQHLRDSRSQYRVNWVGTPIFTTATGEAYNWDLLLFNGTTSTYQHAVTHIFPWNMSTDRGPLTPVVRVMGRTYTDTETFSVVAYMAPHNHTIGDRGRDESLVNDGRAWKWTGTTTASAVSDLIAADNTNKSDDDSFVLDAMINGYAEFRTWELDYDSNTNYVQTPITLYKLSIYAMADGYITGISLREFSE
jgi:hypothetical protein